MLETIPDVLPAFPLLVDDLHLTAPRLARHLGVSVRQARRWLAAGSAPRPVLVALWACSTWGRSAVNSRAENDARLLWRRLDAAQRENAAQAEALRGMWDRVACAYESGVLSVLRRRSAVPSRVDPVAQPRHVGNKESGQHGPADYH